MNFESDFSDFSREELYSVINQLNCYLIKSKSLIDFYKLYFDFIEEITEKFDSNNDFPDLSAKLNILNYEKHCFLENNLQEKQTSLNEILSNEPIKSDLRSDDNSEQTYICEDNNWLCNDEDLGHPSTDPPSELRNDYNSNNTETEESSWIPDEELFGFESTDPHKAKKALKRAQNIIECLFCGKLSKHLCHAKTHLLAVHPEECPEVPYMECTHSGCQFKTKCPARKKRHDERHILLFVCKHCGKRLDDELSLRDHLLTHSEPRKCCPVCKKTLSRSHFSRHKKVHIKDKLFVCTFNGCKHSFVKESRLRQHLRSHENQTLEEQNTTGFSN